MKLLSSTGAKSETYQKFIVINKAGASELLEKRGKCSSHPLKNTIVDDKW